MDALHNIEFAGDVANWEGRNQSFIDAVATIGTEADAVEITATGGVDNGADRVHHGVGCAGRTRGSTRLDDRRTALLHRFDEIALEPIAVVDHVHCGLAVDSGIREIGILRGGVVAPDRHVGDCRNVYPGLLSELRLGAVFVEARHCKPPVVRHIRCVVHGDQAVGVARVADDECADVAGSVVLDRLALACENLAVDSEQIAALHSLFSGDTADK